jgi:methionine aminopeptidase
MYHIRSINEIICHGIPDVRELQDGDICNIDVSTYHNGVHGDLNETYFIGTVDSDGRRVVETAKQCMDKAIEIGWLKFLFCASKVSIGKLSLSLSLSLSLF